MQKLVECVKMGLDMVDIALLRFFMVNGRHILQLCCRNNNWTREPIPERRGRLEMPENDRKTHLQRRHQITAGGLPVSFLSFSAANDAFGLPKSETTDPHHVRIFFQILTAN